MKRCKACGRACRKTQLALVPTVEGVKRARVCAQCIARGITIIPTTGAQLCLCGSLATTCLPCGRKKEKRDHVELVKAACAKLRKLAGAYRASGSRDGRGDGLDQAADILEAGDF